MALISKNHFNCVAALGYQYFDQESGQNKLHWFGTSILWGEKAEDGNYVIYLVTNKHVLHAQNITPNIIVRFSPGQAQSANNFTLAIKNAQGNPLWIEHPLQDVDIAIIPINGQLLEMKDSLNFFSTENSCQKSELIASGQAEGEGCFLLGYPLNIIDMYNLIYPVVRKGSIAEIQSYYNGYNACYLIDIDNFPGNSGGPVINKAVPINSDTSSTQNNGSKLIGIVKSYIFYRETAASLQTGRHRISFEENSGLAWVEPIDRIIETVHHYNVMQYNNNMLQSSLSGLS